MPEIADREIELVVDEALLQLLRRRDLHRERDRLVALAECADRIGHAGVLDERRSRSGRSTACRPACDRCRAPVRRIRRWPRRACARWPRSARPSTSGESRRARDRTAKPTRASSADSCVLMVDCRTPSDASAAVMPRCVDDGQKDPDEPEIEIGSIREHASSRCACALPGRLARRASHVTLAACADEPNRTRAAIGSGARRHRHSDATASARSIPNTAGRSRR